jgi:hypothetical protein
MLIKLIARFLIGIFVMVFSICGFCVVIKSEYYNDHEYVAKTVLALLSKKELVGLSRNDALIPWQNPPGTNIERIQLVFDKVKGRYFLDVQNPRSTAISSGCYYSWSSGQIFEFKNGGLKDKGEYHENSGLFENEIAYDLELKRLDEIFTIDGDFED